MTDKHDFARTMRIELNDDEQKIREDGHTVKIRLPDQGIGSTSFLQQSRTEIRESDASDYQRLLQSIYDAVLITDASGVVRECNHRAIDFFRWPEQELIGISVPSLISGADDAVVGTIRRNLIEHRYTLIEGTCKRKDGTTFPSEIAVNRLDTDLEGRLCFFIRDVSVRKRAQDALEEAITKLEQHDRNRSQFISNVSHELRTPLTSMIYAITNMIRGVVGPLNDHAQKYLEMLLGDCRRLLATVNDILDLRKIENETLTLTKASVPFGRLVTGSARSMAVQAEQKSISLNIDTGSGLWFVNCDAQKIERVVLNLVGNAIKFTSKGGFVNVTVRADETHAGFVRVIVDDNGVGIPADALPRVTDRYFTVGEQASGSGLGLAISKEIVAMHEGELTVESPPPGMECGTRIAFRLPIAEAPTVLIVDDDHSVLDLLRMQISEHGYHVITAENGGDALKWVHAERPDIMILDMLLPDIEGSEVILRLKSDPTTVRLPILVVTGAHIGQSKVDVLRNFGIPALSKPWDETELLDGIANAFLGSLPFSPR
jgi:PAS domain S-box-containing protein